MEKVFDSIEQFSLIERLCVSAPNYFQLRKQHGEPNLYCVSGRNWVSLPLTFSPYVFQTVEIALLKYLKQKDYILYFVYEKNWQIYCCKERVELKKTIKLGVGESRIEALMNSAIRFSEVLDGDQGGD